MKIRLATHADAEQVNALRHQVNELHVLGKPEIFRDGFNEALQNHLFTFLDETDKAVLVAETADGIVGFACLHFVDRPETPYSHARHVLHVDEFGVDEKHRRQGIGRTLFAGIKSLGIERGYERIELDVWSFNEEALRFYEALGFCTYRRYMEYEIADHTKEETKPC